MRWRLHEDVDLGKDFLNFEERKCGVSGLGRLFSPGWC